MSDFENAFQALAEAQAAVDGLENQLKEEYRNAKEAYRLDPSAENKARRYQAAENVAAYRRSVRLAQGTVAPVITTTDGSEV